MARRLVDSVARIDWPPPVTEVPLTLSIRFRADSVATLNLAWLSNSFVTEAFGMYLDSAGKLHGYVAASAASDFTTTTSYSAGAWHHACLVCTSSAARTVYLDGGGQTTNTDVRNVNPAEIDFFRVGWFTNSLVGSVAEVGVWSAALTDAEVQALAKGVSCRRVRPSGLRFYAPLIRDIIDLYGRSFTEIGTIVAPHPRVYL